MGVFDRLGNLGKGMLGIIRSDGPTAKERKEDALEEELAALKAARQVGQEAAGTSSSLDKLKALHARGLLTDEEYAAKVAEASGLVHDTEEPAGEPDHDGPIKKTL